MQSKSATLAGKLRTTDAFIVAPGVYDMISAKMADRVGFHALYMTARDGRIPSRAARCRHCNLYRHGIPCRARRRRDTDPLIADADTGYGGPVNVRETVRGYEMAGVSAIQIEDQDFPKKCGHLSGHKLIPAEEMVTKIKVAIDSRLSDDTLIIARTDARKAVGRDEAMRRSELYVKAGADVLFYEAPSNVDEMREIGSRFGGDIPLLSNMVNGGVTPVMKPRNSQIWIPDSHIPVRRLLATCNALNAVYGSLKQDGDAETGGVDLFSFGEFNDLMGFNDIVEFEERYN